MLVIDEYLAMRVLVGARPDELPDDEPLALPAYRHYWLLQRVHQPGTGQLSAPAGRGRPASHPPTPPRGPAGPRPPTAARRGRRHRRPLPRRRPARRRDPRRRTHLRPSTLVRHATQHRHPARRDRRRSPHHHPRRRTRLTPPTDVTTTTNLPPVCSDPRAAWATRYCRRGSW